jgi:hypothetical protein
MLLNRLVGTHLVHCKVERKAAGDGHSAGKKGWHPTRAEIQRGFAFINRNCPGGYEPNEILQWCVEHVVAEAGDDDDEEHEPCPIFQWPMGLVKEACGNLQKRIESADAEYFFPLLPTSAEDFKSVLVLVVLPLIIAFGSLSGLFIAGVPAVGKTPWCCAIAMMFGRMHVRLRQLLRRAGWRRGKQFDVFRGKPGEVQEAILLDDPTLGSIPDEDLMSFGDLGFQGHSNARYTPPKWAKNQWRAIMSNAWNRDAEPPASSEPQISYEVFEKMLHKSIGHMTEDHRLAFLKRFVSVVVGQHGVYVRAPSEDKEMPIFRFTADSICTDFLVDPGHKSFFGSWKQGDDKTYPRFAEALAREEAVMDEVKAATTGLTSEKDIAQWWIENVAKPHHSRQAVITLPSSPDDPAVRSVPIGPDGRHQLPPVPVIRPGATRRSRFAMPSRSDSYLNLSSSSSSSRPPVPVVKQEIGSPERAWHTDAHRQLSTLGPISVEASPAKRSRCDVFDDSDYMANEESDE